MARAALENLEAAGIERPKAADGTPMPIPNTADTGYFSEEAVEGLEQHRHGPVPRRRAAEAPRGIGASEATAPRPRRV